MASRYNLINTQKRAKSKGVVLKNNKPINRYNNKRDDSYDPVFKNNENNLSTIKKNNIKEPFESIMKYINNANIDDNIPKNKLNKQKKNEHKLVYEIFILVKLYFMERNIKSSFSDLNKNDKRNKFYLINKTFIENFKKNFDYEYIKSHLFNFKENDNLTKDIIFQLSINNKYIDQIKMNKNIVISHKNEEFIKNIDKKSFKFLIEYEIINELLYDLFNKSNYLDFALEEVDVYDLFNNKILVKYKSSEFYSQIGYIDENNIFIPEFFLDIKDNIQNNEKLSNFLNNNLARLDKNHYINFYKIDNIICYKIIDEINLKRKDYNLNILAIKRDKNLKINSYCCINCNSEIVMHSIYSSENNRNDIIKYKCSGACGMRSMALHEYLNKMLLNTYLYNNCYICGSINIDSIHLNEKNPNIFSFCFSCKKIFCNNNIGDIHMP